MSAKKVVIPILFAMRRIYFRLACSFLLQKGAPSVTIEATLSFGNSQERIDGGPMLSHYAQTSPAKVRAFFVWTLAAAMFIPTLAHSHPVVIDGLPGEWVTSPPANLDAGHLGRLGAVGEYCWSDRPGDERTDFAAPDPSVDLISFQVTADPTGMSFIGIFDDISITAGEGAPMLQIAVDRTPESGTTSFAGLAETEVAPSAAWERLIVTRFGSGNAGPSVFDESFVDVRTVGLEAIHSSFDTIELWVPWEDLGGLPTAPIRFTVAVFRGSSADEALDVGGENVSDALEAVTNYGNPGSVLNTLDEVSDSIVDYHFEVWFHLNSDFDPFPPILISEFFYDTPGIDTHEEWIELYNVTGVNLSLTDWRIGDEESIDGTEGMYRFPIGSTLPLGDVAVMALRSNGFQALNNGVLPDYEVINTVIFVPEMVAEPLWASGTMELNNFGDEILILDPYFTAMDVATYENGNYPGVNRSHGLDTGQSLQRLLPTDTNDCVVDFREQSVPGPGEPWIPAVAAPLSSGYATLPTLSPNPMTTQTTIRFELKNPARATLAVFDIQGRRVQTLADQLLQAGAHEVHWDGSSSAGNHVSSGVYVVRLSSTEGVWAKRLTLIH
jgi:hypothetical protein